MPSATASGSRESFFPKADAAVLKTKYTPPSPTSRPSEVGPILDPENANRALDIWSAEVARDIYPQSNDIWSPAHIPDEKISASCLADRYLFPILTRNERLRLTMLFYYTRGAVEDSELVSRLQEKVHIARETVGWEFAIAGLLDHNTYTRICTVGLPLAVLPRRESTCAHTVNQPPGEIFHMINMAKDWRFEKSPHVEQGGLRAYAGVPLRFESEFGEHVAFGSLCVASNSEQPPLSKPQQISLARLADWIVADIVHSARAKRQRERRRMMELLSEAQDRSDHDDTIEDIVRDLLQQVYPEATISIQPSIDSHILLEGGTEVPVNEIQHGLWEDGICFDHLIEKYNHQDPIAPRVVRVIAAQCASQHIPTYLVVSTKDFRIVFDDIDSSFMHMAAQLLCRGWQNRALKEALAAKDNFLRGITHQLRTPIHGILGSIELLDEELGIRELGASSARRPSIASNPEIDHKDPNTYIKTIRRSARELISTVNGLINLNRWADIAQAERNPALHHINEIERVLLNEVIQANPEQISTRPSLIFKHHLPPGYDSLMMDLRLFVDCVEPLITNAVQNAVGGIVCVTTSVTDDTQSLIVDVEDTGRGICPRDQDRIFTAYEKVDQHTTGAGLGLTLSCRLATIMNGVVTLESSALGKGSHFRATFADITCGQSINESDRIKSSAGRPPLTFHAPILLEAATPLSRYFVQYLIHHGHVQSSDSDGLLLIFDHSTDCLQASQLKSGQVGICLIPDFTYVALMTDDHRIRRDNNIIYVKGPLLSNILEEALDQAHAMLIEPESLKNAPETTIILEESMEPSQLATMPENYPSVPTPPISRSSTPVPMETLTVSLKTLQIKAPSPSLATPTKILTKQTTLVVDDNAINLQFLEMYCHRRGIPHCTATDGLKAVQTFSTHQASSHQSNESPQAQLLDVQPIKLILMDLQMPNCDGIEATRQIRLLEQENGWPKAIIVIVTGQDSLSDRTKSREAGADEFLVKPVGPKALDRRIKEWFPDVNV
ncbi:hypothetical protein N0V90_003865 [Kalmusia sp. IMI 367209]|nr:hypothetical protein N0V90_003865 [Kalmusia sp. IMI 367209]